MALMNFSLPFSGPAAAASNWVTATTPNPIHVTAVNNLLYGPENHQSPSDSSTFNQQQSPQYYKNDPYAPPSATQQPPTQYQRQTYHYRSRNNYLPPALSLNGNQKAQPPPPQHIPQLQPPLPGDQLPTRTITNYQQQSHHTARTYGESSYESHEFYNENISSSSVNNSDVHSQATPYEAIAAPQTQLTHEPPAHLSDKNLGYPPNRPTYTQVQAGVGTKTQVHAVLDYDNDEYYDEENVGDKATVTPIQGPIFVKNNSVPVVPLFSYPTMNNGTFLQIPIWWTALSVALGLEVRGEVIKGTPCVKRNNQLFCPTAGNSYPIERIEEFIDENKALMRRMYGDFSMEKKYGRPPEPSTRKKRDAKSTDHIPGVPDIMAPFGHDLNLVSGDGTPIGGDSYFGHYRTKRQASVKSNLNSKANQRDSGPSKPNFGPNAAPNPSSEPSSGRLDACESKIEIVTPYWASNSAGKIRAIVNTQHFEQAIHQEVCTKMQTSRCGGDCGCEQKYKWHRLLAYDPDNDCKGIFMDWFLFPSCCVCRCNPN